MIGADAVAIGIIGFLGPIVAILALKVFWLDLVAECGETSRGLYAFGVGGDSCFFLKTFVKDRLAETLINLRTQHVAASSLG